MRLFIRDHLSLIIFNSIQLFMILSIYWLDGYRNHLTALYSIFFGMFLLTIYLFFRYLTNRSIYRRLSSPFHNWDEFVLTRNWSPLAKAIQRLLRTQYRFYQEQIRQYESKQEQHITFINQWVHQMKTPLSVIHLTLKGKIDPIFESIREETDRMEKGLETILYTSRLDVFEQDFHVEQVPLHSLISSVIHDNKRSFIRNDVYPNNSIDESIVVESDAKWLSFMIGQITINAIRYSAGTGEKIEFSSYRRGKNLVLEVRDYGIGIPIRDQKRVFDPYFTGENGRKYRESTGMGLYLVKEVCTKLHHGVELESIAGEGTMVRIIFHLL
ncbi:signal transduction histidine kinase [Croceifilum oryzae]|uniref:histidine kinase n=1 Tax=Croceifilum oryzae TaxID=1553429 RepID=A0AAJ1THC1_9BACL|nr:sensor histidine kinase [Croceifilum oryzae]MDQ0416992.1 signal transduction histidine kinase [Croceifilum oryzae]